MFFSSIEESTSWIVVPIVSQTMERGAHIRVATYFTVHTHIVRRGTVLRGPRGEGRPG